MKTNPDQLDFGHRMIASEYEAFCIDQVLHSTENQWVLRQLLAGASWAEAAGKSMVGHCGRDARWDADTRGLNIYEGDQKRRIMPAQILARAKLYQPTVEKPF